MDLCGILKYSEMIGYFTIAKISAQVKFKNGFLVLVSRFLNIYIRIISFTHVCILDFCSPTQRFNHHLWKARETKFQNVRPSWITKVYTMNWSITKLRCIRSLSVDGLVWNLITIYHRRLSWLLGITVTTTTPFYQLRRCWEARSYLVFIVDTYFTKTYIVST